MRWNWTVMRHLLDIESSTKYPKNIDPFVLFGFLFALRTFRHSSSSLVNSTSYLAEVFGVEVMWPKCAYINIFDRADSLTKFTNQDWNAQTTKSKRSIYMTGSAQKMAFGQRAKRVTNNPKEKKNQNSLYANELRLANQIRRKGKLWQWL